MDLDRLGASVNPSWPNRAVRQLTDSPPGVHGNSLGEICSAAPLMVIVLEKSGWELPNEVAAMDALMRQAPQAMPSPAYPGGHAPHAKAEPPEEEQGTFGKHGLSDPGCHGLTSAEHPVR